VLNISNAVKQSQKRCFLTPRQSFISIAVVTAKRNITAADREAAKKLRDLWANHQARTGETQEQAGELIGLSQAAFSQYLNCDIALNPRITLKFARHLGVHPSSIRADITELLYGLDVQAVPPDVQRLADAIVRWPAITRNNVIEYAIYEVSRPEAPLTEEQRAEYVAILKTMKIRAKQHTRP
jgi:hypothetical protein